MRPPGPREPVDGPFGEGCTSAAEWRAVHEGFRHGAEMREEPGDPDFTVDDDTRVPAQRFRLVHTA